MAMSFNVVPHQSIPNLDLVLYDYLRKKRLFYLVPRPRIDSLSSCFDVHSKSKDISAYNNNRMLCGLPITKLPSVFLKPWRWNNKTPDDFECTPTTQGRTIYNTFSEKQKVDQAKSPIPIEQSTEMPISIETVIDDPSISSFEENPLSSTHFEQQSICLEELASVASQQIYNIKPLVSGRSRHFRKKKAYCCAKNKRKPKRTHPCQSCNTLESPQWRQGPNGGGTLCNACGLQYAKNPDKPQFTSLIKQQ